MSRNLTAGLEIMVRAFQTSALYGGERSVSHSGQFTPRKIGVNSRWIVDWLGLRSGLVDVLTTREVSVSPGI
jgi:hypothetical protein